MSNIKNCIFGGRCQDCGRYERLGLDARKEKMTLFPDSFIANLPKGIKKGYGVAFDIGTTTIVGLLWDLSENKTINIFSSSNPQSAYGQDVISRINYCIEEPNGLTILNHLIIGCLNDIINELMIGIPIENLTTIVSVGNTTMCHILLGKDPISLSRAPFKPEYTGSIRLQAKNLGFNVSKDVELHVLAGIAGHVGSDITAGMVANDILNLKGTTLYVDVGTNGEIVLASCGELFACSAAAGPAFEGASIRYGMRASAGAIEKVEISKDGVTYNTVLNQPASGICGSGLIDAIAQMLDWGIINYKGRMCKPKEAKDSLPQALANLISLTENGLEFLIAEGISITQNDVREVQLAKGAILAGAMLLLDNVEKTPEDIDSILIAGAFGNYIDKVSALKIGLFPPVKREKIINVGNSAGVGACMVLLSDAANAQAESIPKMTQHVNLASHPDFELCYARSMYFPI